MQCPVLRPFEQRKEILGRAETLALNVEKRCLCPLIPDF